MLQKKLYRLPFVGGLKMIFFSLSMARTGREGYKTGRMLKKL